MNKLPLVLTITIIFSLLSAYANQIDIGLFESGTIAGQIDVKIRPDFDIYYPQTITAILYTIRWDDPSIEINTQSFYPFFINSIGVPEEYNGYYYQSFAAIPFNSIAISADQEILASSFTYTNGDCATFEIIEDEWTSVNNGNLYLEFIGSDVSGIIYQPILNFGGAGGIIVGTDTIFIGNSTGNMNLLNYQGNVHTWQRKFENNSWEDIPGTLGLTTYSEIPPAIGSYTYRARVQNASCPEVFSNTLNIQVIAQEEIELSLKVYLEGGFITSELETDLNQLGYIPNVQPYSETPWNYAGTESFISIPNPDVTDWVLVELRETAGSASTATIDKRIARQAGLLLKDGTIVGTDGISNLTFDVTVGTNLYVVIWHRNHLSVMSSVPLSLSVGSYDYDFTTGALKAYGLFYYGHKEISPGIWGMIGGDGNSDGEINDNDILNTWTNQAGKKGYLSSDYTMDAQSNNSDKNDIWYINNGSASQVPD